MDKQDNGIAFNLTNPDTFVLANGQRAINLQLPSLGIFQASHPQLLVVYRSHSKRNSFVEMATEVYVSATSPS